MNSYSPILDIQSYPKEDEFICSDDYCAYSEPFIDFNLTEISGNLEGQALSTMGSTQELTRVMLMSNTTIEVSFWE